jgi:hypothetical protein
MLYCEKIPTVRYVFIPALRRTIHYYSYLAEALARMGEGEE